MSLPVLDQVAREASGRIVGALAARFRDLDIAEDAFADACVNALEGWPTNGVPCDPAAWLYRVAERKAVDMLRRRRTRERLVPALPQAGPSAEEVMMDDARVIPDERLRLMFVCCHPALAPDSRIALTLRLVCGLSVGEIAQAFLVSEATLAQRLVRAKRKISEAGVPFEVPGREAWDDRLQAVLSTIEITYGKSHEDAAGESVHAAYSSEVLGLTRMLVEMLPREPEVLALASLVRYSEARRPARVDDQGSMVPLAEQDPSLWLRMLIDEADLYLKRAWMLGLPGARVMQAAIHGTWCWRTSLDEPAPWLQILALYDALLLHRDDVVVRINRLVALAEVEGVSAALVELSALPSEDLIDFLPYHALRADLLRKAGRTTEAREAYRTAVALKPGAAERLWLEQCLQSCE